jgi:hypothetical protein
VIQLNSSKGLTSGAAYLFKSWISKFPEDVFTTDGKVIIYCLSLYKMETHGLEMNEFSLILFNVRQALEASTGECGQKVREKFYEVLKKNPDLETIKKIAKVISGEIVDDLQMSPTLIPLYKFAPLTSCDVERSFSAYKFILSDRRTKFTPEHLEQYLICNCEQRN